MSSEQFILSRILFCQLLFRPFSLLYITLLSLLFCLLFFLLNSDVQVCELYRVDNIGSTAHEVCCILVLGEGNDFADAVRAGQEHDEAVNAVSQSCVRRNLMLKAVSRKPNFSLASSLERPMTSNIFS